MGKAMERLKSFMTEIQFDDLDEDVVHEMKRVLLDSIGCAIAGLTTEQGKIAVKLAKELGGPKESTIIGTSDKVSSVNAAFANGKLINALEFDSLSAGGHDAPCIIAAISAWLL